MKEITSKRTKKIQIVSDEVWNNIVGRGWAKLYNTVDLPERKLKDVPIIKVEKPIELTNKPKSKK